MKKRILITLLMSSLILTSCGNSKYSEDTSFTTTGVSVNSIGKNESSEYFYTEDISFSDESDNSLDLSDSNSSKTSDTDKNTIEAESIQRDMLVYSCDMNIDVLEFDNSIENYRKILDKYNGFIGNEYFNDGGSTSRWYSSSAQKWKSYSATVRVPSSSYDDFCSEISKLGDLRHKSATVENVSTEYSDLSTTLEIYEKKEKRYLDMLSEIKDEAQAVVIEDKLTEIQIEIAKIKTRMNQIKTDVAYSYVSITINEVKEYTEEPIRTDTFGQRLIKTLKDTGYGFLRFLEDALFLVINLLPYALLLFVAIYIFGRLIKTIKKAREKKRINKQQTVQTENKAEKNIENKE